VLRYGMWHSELRNFLSELWTHCEQGIPLVVCMFISKPCSCSSYRFLYRETERHTAASVAMHIRSRDKETRC
jgi:hypothetical protein